MFKRTAGYMSLLLGLVLTSAVAADDRNDRDRYDDDRYDRGRYDDRHDRDRYDGRYGRYDSSELRELAYELERLTNATYRTARDDFRGTYRGRGRDRYGRTSDALADLNRLDDRARIFRREINRTRNDRRDSEREFQALENAFREASSSLSAVRPERDVRRLWNRVDETMEELDDFYGGSRYSYWRGRD